MTLGLGQDPTCFQGGLGYFSETLPHLRFFTHGKTAAQRKSASHKRLRAKPSVVFIGLPPRPP